MCAVFGFAGKSDRVQWPIVRRLLHELFFSSAVRGTDASGFAAVVRGGHLVADKGPLPGPMFSATSREWQRLSHATCVIGHCRAATHGSPDTGDSRNNHPFIGDERELAVAVNGVAHNYREVANAHGLALRTECDSEVFLRLIEAIGHPAAGLQTALEQLRGGSAAAVLDRRGKCIWLSRNVGRPLWLFEVAGIDGRLFCSTEAIALDAHRRAFQGQPKQPVRTLVPVAADVVIRLGTDGTLTVADPSR